MSLSDLFLSSLRLRLVYQGFAAPNTLGLIIWNAWKIHTLLFLGAKAIVQPVKIWEKKRHRGDEIFSSAQALQLFFRCMNVKKHMQSEMSILRRNNSYSSLIQLCQLFRAKSPHRHFTHLCLITFREFGYNHLAIICFVVFFSPWSIAIKRKK